MADHGSHLRHDRFAIADAIGGGSSPSTIGSCPACRTLHLDLLTLQQAVRAAWAPHRPRDLRLTASDAARLQRGRWRRLFQTIGTPHDVLTRPLALSFTGLGLAGLLLTTVPAGLSMGASGAAAPIELNKTMVAAETPSAVAGPPTDLRDRPSPVDPTPANLLPTLSVGLLTLGAALFVARRLARSPERVR